jgi:hypothetical protein
MANTYKLIEAKTLSSSQSSVEFTSIPQTYTDLLVKASLRGDSTYDLCWIRFNSVSTNLSGKSLQGNGSSVNSFAEAPYGRSQTSSSTANTFSSIEAYITNYASSDYKSISVDSVGENNAAEAYLTVGAGLWSNTSAITSIQFVPSGGNFVSGSTFYLYGVKNS